MRKVILSVMTTLDGFTAGPNGELEWIDVADDELDTRIAELLAGIDGSSSGAWPMNFWRSIGPPPKTRTGKSKPSRRG